MSPKLADIILVNPNWFSFNEKIYVYTELFFIAMVVALNIFSLLPSLDHSFFYFKGNSDKLRVQSRKEAM